jgi:hypothetical protein
LRWSFFGFREIMQAAVQAHGRHQALEGVLLWEYVMKIMRGYHRHSRSLRQGDQARHPRVILRRVALQLGVQSIPKNLLPRAKKRCCCALLPSTSKRASGRRPGRQINPPASWVKRSRWREFIQPLCIA